MRLEEIIHSVKPGEAKVKMTCPIDECAPTIVLVWVDEKTSAWEGKLDNRKMHSHLRGRLLEYEMWVKSLTLDENRNVEQYKVNGPLHQKP